MYKSEISKLKSTTQKPLISVHRDSPGIVKHPSNRSLTTEKLENVPYDAEVSLNKAKELEKRLKNQGKESLVSVHRYGTRRATRKCLTRTSGDYGDIEISKQKLERLTGSQTETKTSEDCGEHCVTSQTKRYENCGTSQIGTMEEMFNQLSSMRREIDILKQTTLVRSGVSVLTEDLQPAVANVSNINIPSSADTAVVNRRESEIHCDIMLQNPVNTSVSYMHSSLSQHNPADNICDKPNTPAYYETSSHFPEKKDLSSEKIISVNAQLPTATHSQIISNNCSSTYCVKSVTSAGTETSGILDINQLECVRTEVSAANTLLPALSMSTNTGSLDSAQVNALTTVAGSTLPSKASGNIDNLYAAAKILTDTLP